MYISDIKSFEALHLLHRFRERSVHVYARMDAL